MSSEQKSRIAYVGQCTFEYLISLLLHDAFLAKLLLNIGLDDSMIGIISSFVSFSFLFQLLSIWLVNHITYVKKAVIFFDCFTQFLFMFMYCVPFLNVGKPTKIVIAISCLILAYVSKHMVSSILFKWANSYVDSNKRGRFSAGKEMISLVCGMLFSLVMGIVVDKKEAVDDIKGSFVIIIITLLVLNILNFASLMMIKDGKLAETKKSYSVKEVVANTLGNKSFRNVIILLALWSAATHMISGFMGTFKTKDLMLSVGLIQVINALANGMRMTFSIPIGKYSDKKSYAKGIELAMIIASFGFFANMFSSNKTWWMVIIFTVFYNVSIAGTNANKLNITYSYVNSEYITQAMVIQNGITGIVGFISAFLGSRLLEYIQGNGNVFLGLQVYSQQVMSGISLIIVLCGIVFNRLVVQKQPVMKR